MLCSCPATALCERCRREGWMRHRGTVACRTETFVVRRRRLPTEFEARDAVDDLARDRELLEMFAAEWLRTATERWRRARRDAGDWMWRS